MSKSLRLRDDLTVKTFSLPPADIDRLAADRETVLAHGFIPKPTWHKKLATLWERAARDTTSFASPRVRLLPPVPQGIIPLVSGADLSAPSGQLNWVTTTSVAPSLTNPGAGSTPNPPGSRLSFAMGISLNRKTSAYLFAGISWSYPSDTMPAGEQVQYQLVLLYAGPQTYTVQFDTSSFSIVPDMPLYFYLSANNLAGAGVVENSAHFMYQAGGVAGAAILHLTAPTSLVPFNGATDAAWTIEDSSVLPRYSQVTFEGATAGESCGQASPSFEPTAADALSDGSLSVGNVSNGNVTCSYQA